MYSSTVTVPVPSGEDIVPSVSSYETPMAGWPGCGSTLTVTLLYVPTVGAIPSGPTKEKLRPHPAP